MKNILKRAIGREEGAVLILALILLVVGGLIVAPLLGFMSTGLVTGQVYEKKTDELYAADAGVEDAIWKIQNRVPDSYPYSYPDPLTEDPFIVNGKSVDVVVYRYDWDPTCGENLTYQVLSTATSDDGSSTKIDAHLSVSYLDFSALLDHAIVSNDTIDIQPNSTVDGDVWLPINDEEHLNNKGNITGVVFDNDDVIITWPTYEQLSPYYLEDVEGAPDPGPSIDIKDTETIGPCDRKGSLDVDNTGAPATLVLQGTVYIRGDLDFRQSGSHSYTVDLNGHTIFVEGGITFASEHIIVSGSGCIIAVRDIVFQPSIASGEDDFVLVLSLEGLVDFQPSGDFTGCVAGNVNVELSPKNEIYWMSPEGKGLNIPWGAGDIDKLPPVTGVSIVSWQIK